MGKEKKAQRTKGNIRPSSSARSAEQLAATGGATGFVGFGALSGDLGYVPAATGPAGEDDSGVDADFRLVLRKLSKRDATTKLKALQEFAALCKEKDIEDVKTVLPYWPRLYSKTSIDYDRRVREAAQQAFVQLVLRVRRNLAPHLKALMGCWIVAQCDLYAPAASAAKLAFQTAFPPAKQTEAFLFCKDEIMLHLQDNMFHQTPQTLSDPKSTEPEDMETKYVRVVSSSLMALKLFINSVPTESQASHIEKYSSFLKEGKFWKLGKHTNNMIRGSFYVTLAAICQSQPELANNFADKICPIVLQNLDESDLAVGPAVWEAALQVVANIEDCWMKVNARKGVLPKLWTLFKNGGYGNATSLYSNMLPFLSKIPDSVVGQGTGFYEEWFTNLRSGLNLDKVLVSPSECNAIMSCYMECLRYCLVQQMMAEKPDKSTVDFLIQDQLFTILEASIVEKNPALANTSLYNCLADILQYLYNMSTKEKRPTNMCTGDVEGGLWSGLCSLCQNLIVTVDDNNTYILDRIAQLLEAFREPQKVVTKKTGKVRFAEESDGTRVVSDNDKPISQAVELTSKNDQSRENACLIGLVCEMCGIAYEKAKDLSSLSPKYLTLLSKLFTVYASPVLIETLLESSLGQRSSTLDIGLPLHFSNVVVFPWFLAYEASTLTAAQKGIFEKCLVDILLATSKVCPSEEKKTLCDKMLNDITRVKTLNRLIGHLTMDGTDKEIAKWLKGDKFGQKMVSITRNLCEHSLALNVDELRDIDAHWQLLSMALSTDDRFEPVIGCHYMEMIIDVIKTALPSPAELSQSEPQHVDHCVSFVCQVSATFFSNVKGCLMIASAEEVLFSIIQLICHQTPLLSDTSLERVYQTCDQGVKALLHQKGGFLNEEGFFAKAAKHITFQVLNNTDNMTRLEMRSSVALRLCRCMAEYFSDSDDSPIEDLTHPTIQEFIKLLAVPFMHSQKPTWLSPMIFPRSTLYLDIPETVIGSGFIVPKCVAPTTFTSTLLVALHNNPVTTVAEEREKSITDVPAQHMLDILYDIAVCKAIVCERKEVMKNSDLVKACKLLEENFTLLLETMPVNSVKELCHLALEKSMADGVLWASALGHLARSVEQMRISVNWLHLAGSTDRFSTLIEPSVQTLTTIMPYLTKSEVTQMAEIQAAQIMSCEQESYTNTSEGSGFLAVFNAALSLQESPMGDLPVSLGPDVVLAVFGQLQTWAELQDSIFLFDSCVNISELQSVYFNLQAMEFLRLVVEKVPTKLKDTQWDFVLCSLIAWVQTCHESRSDLGTDLPVQAFCCEVFKLVSRIAQCIQNVVPEQAEEFPPNLATEWREFFSEASFALMLPMYVTMAGSLGEDPSGPVDLLIKCLGQAVSHCPLEHIKGHKLPAKLVAGEESNLPEELQTLLNHLCPHLLSHNRAVQLASYRILLRLMPELWHCDEGHEETEDKEKGEVSRSLPLALMSVLNISSQEVALALCDVPMGDLARIEAYTQEHEHSMAYLLTWKLILVFFKGASSELRAQYAFFLKETKAVDVLMLNLFRLMPECPVIQLKDGLTSQNASQKLTGSKNMFSEEPVLDICGSHSSEELQHLACSVYSWSLQDLPAILRQWWNDQDKQTASIIETFTTKYVSPILSAKELSIISNQNLSLDNMTIKARSVTREVVATYTVEEVSMELVVSLSPNHPLGTISVESGRRVGVANQQWRNWMLQLTTYLNHQNGTISDGLTLWKRNVDKRFEGVEECFICFSVINASNCQLPKPQCKTCKKRFHSACLYKWFSTSNNSTCPLCRNLF